MDKATQARNYFEQGYNCAQSVVAAFAQEMGMDEKTALRLSSSFGGGMGGLRETCGAVSGMFMVLGLLKGYDMPDDPEAKKAHYQRIQALAQEMTAAYGTINCRELLASHGVEAKAQPSLRNEAYYQKRPCARYVEACARMVEEALGE